MFATLCRQAFFPSVFRPKSPRRTGYNARAVVRAWRKQLLTILGHYNKAYDALVDKVAKLADLYHIPVFVEKTEQHKF